MYYEKIRSIFPLLSIMRMQLVRRPKRKFDNLREEGDLGEASGVGGVTLW